MWGTGHRGQSRDCATRQVADALRRFVLASGPLAASGFIPTMCDHYLKVRMYATVPAHLFLCPSSSSLYSSV